MRVARVICSVSVLVRSVQHREQRLGYVIAIVSLWWRRFGVSLLYTKQEQVLRTEWGNFFEVFSPLNTTQQNTSKQNNCVLLGCILFLTGLKQGWESHHSTPEILLEIATVLLVSANASVSKKLLNSPRGRRMQLSRQRGFMRGQLTR